MKLTVKRLETRLPTWFEAFSLFCLVGAAVYIPLSYAFDIHIPSNPFRVLLTDMPCPLCGGTRSVTALCLGRVGTAFAYNPFAPAVFAAMVYAAGSWLFGVLPLRRRLTLETGPRGKLAFKLLLAAALAANWVYVLSSGYYRLPLQI